MIYQYKCIWQYVVVLLQVIPSCVRQGDVSADEFETPLLLKLQDPYEMKYGPFPEDELHLLRKRAKDMFEFGYDNYMRYAFPMDELDPINCRGRGPDYDNPSNININDVLGDYCLTLVDSLDALAIMGNVSEFRRAVDLVIEYVSFDKNNTVQVFEATIRIIGGLLSAHLLITDDRKFLGDFSIPGYNDELLKLADDLANRLLPAFHGTQSNIPHPRVNLRYGVPWDTVNETCTAGAGSLLLEFGVLSRLLGDPTFEKVARTTNDALWKFRDGATGLMGNLINIQTGEWTGHLSGLGAGLDSYFEYMAKSYILFGNDKDFKMFNESYNTIKEYMRRGRTHCNRGEGEHPMYVNVHMHDGTTLNTWIDSLQAAFIGVQILMGDVEEAICAHAVYYNIWKKYGVLPERYNWKLRAPDVLFYPLRPEFAESTYFLYMATKNPFYLHVGKEILENLDRYTRCKCGYATIHDVNDMSLEDRMESFFLSETMKYLYLLFDRENPLNRHFSKFVFTTEGHLLPILKKFHDPPPASDFDDDDDEDNIPQSSPFSNDKNNFLAPPIIIDVAKTPPVVTYGNPAPNASSQGCPSISPMRRFTLPLEGKYMRQLERSIGLFDHLKPSP